MFKWPRFWTTRILQINHRATITINGKSRDMTPEGIADLDAGFAEMDRGFKEMDKAFEAMGDAFSKIGKSDV